MDFSQIMQTTALLVMQTTGLLKEERRRLIEKIRLQNQAARTQGGEVSSLDGCYPVEKKFFVEQVMLVEGAGCHHPHEEVKEVAGTLTATWVFLDEL